MSVYDFNGNDIGVTDEDVKQAVIELVSSGEINMGSVVGATLTYSGLSSAWISNAQNAYDSMLARYKNIANGAIPFFISTDQHGRGVEQHRWVNNVDVDGLNIANINLGDTVTDYYNTYQLSSMYGRTWQVKNYLSITGNHDALYRGDDRPTIYDLTRCFQSTRERNVSSRLNSSYTVVAKEHNVKYMMVDNYYDVGITKEALGNSQLTGDVADWLINEFSKDDYDIIYVQHWHLYALPNVYQYRDGTTDSNGVGGSEVLKNLVTARKNKQSGTVTDKDGNVHSYDFTSCTHELLCALHGHEHAEVYATLNNLLCYVSDWYGNYGSCVFGIVDRFNSKLRIWKFNSTSVEDELILDL